MATSKEDILKAIEEMSVMDLVDLISDIEEKFGVTAAAAGEQKRRGKPQTPDTEENLEPGPRKPSGAAGTERAPGWKPALSHPSQAMVRGQSLVAIWILPKTSCSCHS